MGGIVKKMSRRAKQFVYGLSFLLFWGVIFGGAYLVWFQSAPSCFDNRQNQNETGVDCGGSCISCELKNAQSLQVQMVRVLPLDSKVTLVGRVVNPNEHVAAEEFDYIFTLFGSSDEVIKTVSGKSFVYSNRLRYIIHPGVDISERIARAELVLAAPSWRPEAEFPAPLVRLRESKSETSGTEEVVTSGILVNEGNLPVARATVQALYYGATRVLLGASQTEVRDIDPLQNRRFEIHHPLLPDLDPRATQVFFEAQ